MTTRILLAVSAVFFALLCIALALGALAGHPSAPAVMLEHGLEAVGAGTFSRGLSILALVVLGVAVGSLAPIVVREPDPGGRGADAPEEQDR